MISFSVCFHSIVLVALENGKVSSLEVIFGKSIKKCTLLADCSEQENNLLDQLFKHQEVVKRNADEINKEKDDLKQWLLQNRVPVEEDENGVLRMSDVLFINPPYGKQDCFSTNEIVLSKIHKLIDSVPSG